MTSFRLSLELLFNLTMLDLFLKFWADISILLSISVQINLNHRHNCAKMKKKNKIIEIRSSDCMNRHAFFCKVKCIPGMF